MVLQAARARPAARTRMVARDLKVFIVHSLKMPLVSQPCQHPPWLMEGFSVGASSLPLNSHDWLMLTSSTGRKAMAVMDPHGPGQRNQNQRWPVFSSAVMSKEPRGITSFIAPLALS